MWKGIGNTDVHLMIINECQNISYQQCTINGPEDLSLDLFALLLSRIIEAGVGVLPFSDHLVNWNCSTVLDVPYKRHILL